MKRYLPMMMCAMVCVRVVLAQSAPPQTQQYQYNQQQASNQVPSPPLPSGQQAPPKREVFAEPGRCQVVKPGDIVHYQLTVQNVEYARAVYADLELRRGHGSASPNSQLPLPDYRNLGGGGVATRDAQVGGVYHFTFKVQPDVLSGIYHGSGVWVTLNDNGDVPGRTRSVDVTEHTRKEIKNYCLTVVSPLWGDGRPLVTDFKPGPIEHAK